MDAKFMKKAYIVGPGIIEIAKAGSLQDSITGANMSLEWLRLNVDENKSFDSRQSLWVAIEGKLPI